MNNPFPYLATVQTGIDAVDIPSIICGKWHRQRPWQKVRNDTPSRGNRKRRRHPSWMRTRGRLQRSLNRQLPAEQMCKVVAVARKWRELHAAP